MDSGVLERLCGPDAVFWDNAVSVNTTSPDLTPCFEWTVLVWVPCGFLWLFTIPHLYMLYSSRKPPLRSSWLCFLKTVLSLVLFFIMCIDFIIGVYKGFARDEFVPNVLFLSRGILAASVFLTVIITQVERDKGIRSTGLLFTFWLLALICGVVTLQTVIRSAVNNGVVDSFLYTYSMYVALVIIQFLLSCFADSAPFSVAIDERTRPCPEFKSSFLSRITFQWFTGMAILGYKKALVEDDLWDLNQEDKCGYVRPSFENNWEKELWKLNRSKAIRRTEARMNLDQIKLYQPSLLWAMASTFGETLTVSAFFKVINDVLTFVSPVLLKLLISFTEDKSQPAWLGYFYTIVMFVAAVLQTIVLHQYFHRCFLVGMRMRSAVIAIVYEKALKMSNVARRTSTVGEIVNLMSVDVQRLMDTMTYIHTIWSAPLQIAISLWLLWAELGPSVLTGLAFMILMLPLNAVIASKIETCQVNQMEEKDKRIKLINEILNGVKVLKLYAWEPPFGNLVAKIRQIELKWLKKMNWLTAANNFTWTCTPLVVSLLSFMTYVLVDENNKLTASKAFVSLTLFNILRFPLVIFPAVISFVVQARVSLRRLNKYLSHDDIDETAISHDENAEFPISMDNATFAWDHSGPSTLSNISLQIKSGSLVAVVGQVGAGKSSLISALLGEMEKQFGYVNVKGSIAYVPQQAWIQNATLKSNILFAKPYDEERYKKLIESCALLPDFDILPARDETEIGEKGINLSGGQKQRVSLARAVYANADIYFLDDPLSAVDAHVGKHIFENVIGPRGLLSKKTRILVTHGVSFLPQVDQIVVIKDGHISEVGGYKELLTNNGAFAEFLRNYLTSVENEEEVLDSDDPGVIEEIIAEVAPSLSRQASLRSSDGALSDPEKRRLRKQSTMLEGSLEVSPEKQKEKFRKQQEKQQEDRLIQLENIETGQVPWSVYFLYLKAQTEPVIIFMFIFYFFTYAAQVGSSIWLSVWSTDPDPSIHTRNVYLGVYGVFGFIQGIFVFGTSGMHAVGTVYASRTLHDYMLRNVLKSPMSFFDTTPLGRIVNRFAKDVDVVDNIISMCFHMLVDCGFMVLATLVAVVYSTPVFLAVVPFLTVLYYFAQRFYIATSRQLKRLESVSRSPIYNHFSETVQGASSIRAYKVQERFILENEQRIDQNQICYYPSIISNRWLAIRLEFVGTCIVVFASLFAVIARDTESGISAGLVGLSVSYALTVTQELNWTVRMASEMETNLVAVERIHEYSEITTEAPWSSDDHTSLELPPSTWPERGDVVFEDYSLRYRPGLDLVLRGIKCHISSEEKIGIVGRTGAGKSSMTLALFRIIEAAGGAICIDGRNIASMGLHELRSKLTIIPQDPVLFSGDLRTNLDPFNWYTDDAIWTALQHSHLKDFVSSLPSKLMHEISEGGENLSVGQRQLVCLARALLRKSKVLILDEATAAVDLETDDLIQKTIRVEFADCTVLTIAHRLNTIMDSTRVMVLENGQILEFDAPENLLKDRSSMFYSLAKNAGLTGTGNDDSARL